VSSAILYLAIVAIWAVFLVPRWVHRPHSAAQTPGISAETADENAATDPETEDGDVMADSYSAPTAPPPRLGLGRLWAWRAGRGQADATKDSEPPVVRPALSRTRILQARRRMLTALVTLLTIAASCTAGKLMPWWACVPPAGMLGMYLLLLREAALADAEQVRWRAEDAALRVRAARQRGREAWAAPAPEPTAEIIDISDRIGDQLYDQYADATARAIGD
jgi:hypothetical protein